MIKIDNLTFSYGPLVIFEDFSVNFEEKKVSCILGPSGCGKSTLLNIIAKNMPDNVSFVFQNPRLIPQSTLLKNIEFVLYNEKDKHKRRAKAEHFLELVGLKDYTGFYPHELSGGMEQRAALARAFAFGGRLLLMDEPFKGLDKKTKQKTLEVFLALLEKEPKTTVFVTHDLEEAKTAGNEIFILSDKPAKILENYKVTSP